MFDLFKRDKSLFDDFFADLTRERHVVMKTDIQENDQSYTFQIDMPGFKKEDIKVKLDRGYLTVSVSKTNEIDDKKDNYIRRERSYGEMSRSFYVGDVRLEDLKASYQNGMLEIIVPKDNKLTEQKYLTIE